MMRLGAWRRHFALIINFGVAVMTVLLLPLIAAMLALGIQPQVLHAFPVFAAYHCGVPLFNRPHEQRGVRKCTMDTDTRWLVLRRALALFSFCTPSTSCHP